MIDGRIIISISVNSDCNHQSVINKEVLLQILKVLSLYRKNFDYENNLVPVPVGQFCPKKKSETFTKCICREKLARPPLFLREREGGGGCEQVYRVKNSDNIAYLFLLDTDHNQQKAMIPMQQQI